MESDTATYDANREFLHEQLAELQAGLGDMSDKELTDCRSALLERVNWCMTAILEKKMTIVLSN